MSLGARLFRLLVRVMPGAFRSEYGEEMCRVAEEQWAERPGRAGPWTATRFWLRQSAALLAASARLRGHGNGARGRSTMEGLGREVRTAARGLARRPAFTLVTVTTLALGIGATTAIFSAVRTVLLRPLPYARADEVAVLFRSDAHDGARGDGVSAANVEDFRRAATLFEAVSVAEPWSLDLRVEGRAESLRTWAVGRGFFDAVGTGAALGRTLTDDDYRVGGDASVVVLGHGAWVTRFGADSAIVGAPLQLDGQALTVVGVLPPAFAFPDAAELWIPRPFQSRDEQSRASDFMTGIVRLGDGVSLAQAQAEADRIATSLREAYPGQNADLGYQLVPLREHLFGDVRTPLVVLMVAVAFVLLIACANVAGLMLARGAQREHDFALRGALGAGTGRLMAHVSAESAILATMGCALGVLFTYAGVRGLESLGADHLPRIDEIAVDGTVLAFAVATAALSALVSGVAPSLRLSRPDLRGALGDGIRRSTGSRGQVRARSRLVVAQVAGAVVLLTGAGLLIRSFDALLDQELGFDPSNRLALQLFAYDYEDAGAAQAVVDEIVENMRALPGVTDVAVTTDLPGATDGAISKIDIAVPFTIEGRAAPPEGQEPQTWVSQVYRDYFGTMGIELSAGRTFDAGDGPEGTPVVIVNEALARRHFGVTDVVGERLLVRFRGSVAREIVGVARDTRPLGHASQPRPEAYFPLEQVHSGSLTFVVRATTDAGALAVPAMEAVWAANPAQSVWGVARVDDLVADWHKERRFSLFLITAFSVVALTLSAIGLYGLVSFSVERRLGELGIRRALGGRSADLLTMVIGEGARLAGAGLVIGLVAAVLLSRFLRGMLFEVAPTDPVTLMGLSACVLAVAAVATAAPALRAVRVEPIEALRSE